MTEISRPDFTYQWSSGGSIVAPSNTKIQTGWTAEVPPFQWENWSQNRQDNALVHIFQKGISTWSSTQDYYFAASAPKSFVQGSDGLIYEAVQSSTNQNPTTDTTNTYWRLAFRNQSGAPIYALDTGTANTYKADYVPVVKTLVDGMVLKFKALNANTTASTFTPANGVIAASAIVGGAHSALQGGEIVTNSDVWLQWNSSVGGGSWVLIDSTGGSLQTASATKSQHAANAGQIQSQSLTAFTTTGSAPSFVLTPTPAITAYAAGQRFRVKFSAASAGSDTLNISGLGVKSLKQYDSGGNKVAVVLAANQLADVEYDGTDLVILTPTPIAPRQIQPIAATVAANALTLTLNATILDFRSSTLSSGAINSRPVPSAISLVVPSGATLGTANAVASRLVLLALDNAGTIEPAVVNLAGGNNLDETTLISTTTISASATAANVIYSTTSRTNVPFRVIGFVDSTQATAGTWATAPSTIQGAGGQAIGALSSIGYGQTWQNLTGSRVFGTTYTNTTGKPIMVSINLNQAGVVATVLLINGLQVQGANESSTNEIGTLVVIVPSGSTYVITNGSSSINYWAELR